MGDQMHRLSVRRSRIRAVVLSTAIALVASSCYHWNTLYDGGPLNDPLITETFTLGPYDLAGNDQPGWEVLGNREIPRPTGNVAIKRVDFDVVDGDGKIQFRRKPHRLASDVVRELDWHNELADFTLRLREQLDAAADDKRRKVILRRVKRALEPGKPR